MKINISSIIRDHWKTLRRADSKSLSYYDLLLFYGAPTLLAGFFYWEAMALTRDAYNVSITFFGIFIALMLNIQVAIFGIFQRRWESPTDKRLAEIQSRQAAARRTLLTELNANVSYVVLVCVISLFSVLLFYVQDWKNGVPPAVTVFFYGHFLLTLLMVVKRAHALFQKEYRDTPA
ncbi:hypothetical protein C8J47_3266 [Sphingomonas sp. PP-F2F-G114-C0414]|uniref:hypothetical protein n=1 Tax=Sphingomonas sp. PP-F2F-G114-C0414 TaxID=2135662 RepID=UPI000EF942DE|nr:hypothetical protein [Sphingomonas sp. PP-F2F-G114-C0414]RMB27734.1 hypothetical protein C8J47_3266 [Sphingomonas sp. PP-F2F-G114-C0414]